jgi:acid phosphatase family membrane protein YuiD
MCLAPNLFQLRAVSVEYVVVYTATNVRKFSGVTKQLLNVQTSYTH